MDEWTNVKHHRFVQIVVKFFYITTDIDHECSLYYMGIFYFKKNHNCFHYFYYFSMSQMCAKQIHSWNNHSFFNGVNIKNKNIDRCFIQYIFFYFYIHSIIIIEIKPELINKLSLIHTCIDTS